KLSAKKNYSQIDREATGIMFSLNRFERHLLGRQFIIQTDQKNELPLVVTARFSRFALRLAMFDYKITHVKGFP
ncbi:Putative LOC100494601 (Silurana), partial [Caligus rogercresseyi]